MVYTWNYDFSYYMAPHVGLDRTTFYDRVNGTGYLQNRFDESGRSRVTPGSLVVVDQVQDVWSKPTAHASHWQQVWDVPGQIAVFRVPDVASSPAIAGGGLTPINGTVSASVRMRQPWALPQQHVEVELTVASREDERTTVAVGMDCGSGIKKAREFIVDRATDFLFDLAVDTAPSSAPAECSISVRAPDGGDAWVPLASLTVPLAVEVHPELRFTHDPGLERERGSGWYRVDHPIYAGGGSVVAMEPFRTLQLPVTSIPAGDYWIDLALYDYGSTAENVISVTLNGVNREVRWGGAAAGVIHRVVAFPAVPAGDDLRIEVVSRQQDAVTIDGLVVSSVPPPD